MIYPQCLNIGPIASSVYRTRELPKFLLFGAIAALTTLATSWLLYGAELFPALPYWCATGAGAAVGLVVNFALNYLFNFRYHERSTVQQFITFFVVSGFGILLTSGLSEINLRIFSLLISNEIHMGHILFSKTFAANVTAVALVALSRIPRMRQRFEAHFPRI
jgi:putative flippase GtrA